MSRLTRKPLILLALALTLLQALPPCLADDATRRLSQRIGEIIHGPNYRHARWGILVVDSKTGQEIYSHNADMLCVPASVTKIFSVAAALFLLGVNFLFETPVYYRGKLADGTLDGDLILVASGDLTMGGRTDAQGKMAFRDNDHTYANGGGAELTDTDPLAGLKDLARQVKARGIHSVRGDVLVDDRLFDKSPSTGSGPTLVSPILINDNIVDLIVTPGMNAGDPATVKMRPETSYVQMDAAVITTFLGTNLEVRALGNERFTVRGQIALGSKPQVRIYPVEDPARFARALFIEVLHKEGVNVSASPLLSSRSALLPEQKGYAKLERVALHKSLPFSEVAKVTLKVSHNLYASTMPLLLAAKHGKRTLADGLKIQKQFLSAQGVDLDSISFGGGAGGAGVDRASPRAVVQLLRGIERRPDFRLFEDALPVLGVDGTLADVVGPDSPARGRVRAKTGTYSWFDVLNGRTLLTSKALGGVMTTALGRRLTFGMFVNDVPLGPGITSTREGRALGRICEIIYEHAPR
jgi:D-alanyl-D-alanine carboxypeptidase/D-alanyl-D-alanine-endopeptidase (penicillin-binding protein 4)